MNRKNAFSLAEVLITLMIIAVISAMTVPTLLKNTGEAELVSGCIKAYATLSNAVKSMTAEYGRVGRGKDWVDATTFTNNITKYLNIAKKCNENNKHECFPPSANAKLLSGGASSYTVTGNSFVTVDGMTYTYSALSGTTDYGILPEDGRNAIGRFIVDVNGFEKPNVEGVDLFFFILVKGKGLVPGGNGSLANCSTDGSNSGNSCASRVLKNKAIDYIDKY